ncbi:hypothetical protein HS1genome_1881 [Sulfodiicoccus acidiphilus]|uniref:Uncharacterized protein n=1 Tax=Sulfodiicoccus acidiphilus TaxID=1670455 RepID=A0A348B5P0_9CREN|nr:hypothetical protein HS1genome_1881 [Sulfodiicoccus acidiphilus]GGT92767.1 hypothetical protein GCM10007116_08180 [Sulfodiicoccus acidiphilus]
MWGGGLVEGTVNAEVVDEVRTYLYRNATLHRRVFACFAYTSLGLHLAYSVGDGDERAFREVEKYLPDDGRWVGDDYNSRFCPRDHAVVSPVNPDGSFPSSLRDGLVPRGP